MHIYYSYNYLVFDSYRYASDLAEIGNQLLRMACDPHNASEWAAGETKIWEDTKRGFGAIAEYFNLNGKLSFFFL